MVYLHFYSGQWVGMGGPVAKRTTDILKHVNAKIPILCVYEFHCHALGQPTNNDIHVGHSCTNIPNVTVCLGQ